MNRLSANKLLLSKWTAQKPVNKQKHFLVSELIKDHLDQQIVSCVLEAVIDNHKLQIDWRELKDSRLWIQGWK